MSVEEDWITSKSLAVSQGTPARWHKFVINTGNSREVCFCLALMAISCPIKSPRLMLLRDMIDPRKAGLV
ncbi:hypothetical protein H5410_003909 [Solanum commersonii]|uniref:Uncharacterized protein n=1 Tax=Solanum commersonii TaxID=4109 RepID=A0A9J6B6B0_SOLCO|nr:hypothetical protein H5410_003909 [Solanum commersonii]